MAWDVNELARRIDPRRGGGVVVYGLIIVTVVYGGLSHAWRTGWAEMQAQTDAQVQQVAEAQAARLQLAQQAAQALVRLHAHCQQYPADYGCENLHGKSLDEVVEMQRKQREAIQ
ncbi:TPA: hypothetical protein KCN18_004151 [Escherichia coli]|jgi:hypothetical protein|uniref:hypothetical protein n=1 Tax=Klebsiella pneumoniae TaxID=573 RepID=UPI00299472E6|nr:hypothetical protein [Escherichia coli]HBB7752694.1 hypothetical protein [Escherichia coli]HBB7832148.1 hypothetical protein [Escherichia coli]HBB7860090.1 hypothetical protein [Escherichia coli]